MEKGREVSIIVKWVEPVRTHFSVDDEIDFCNDSTASREEYSEYVPWGVANFAIYEEAERS